MRRKPLVNVVVEDRYTLRSQNSFQLQKDHLRIRLEGRRRNVRNDLENIEEALGHKISPPVLDLYNIALTVFIADIQTFKTDAIGVRNFRILVSVSNLDRWNAVKEHLEAMLNTLTGDNFVFHFVQGRRHRIRRYPTKDIEHVVSLFSGGLDSLAGAKWILDKGLKPIFVSHYASMIVAGVQNILMDRLRNLCGNLPHHQVYAKGMVGTALGKQKEYSQPSRSFLYLSIATMFALELGIRQIFMFENGIIALNIPLTPSRIYLNTRTAHPVFVKMFNKLLGDTFATDLSVNNPFEHLTKGEVVELLNVPGFRDLVKYSSSCFRISRLRWMRVQIGKVKHCGYCYPCVLRRFATDHASLWNHDGKYHQDIFGEFSSIPDEGRTLIIELLDFGRSLERCRTYDEILQQHFAFYVDEKTDPAPYIDAYRRHVQQMKECFIHRGSPSLKARIRQYL